MARNLILLMAIFAVRIIAASTPAQTLSGPHSIKWTDWGIEIDHLEFTDSVTHYHREKTADDDSIFVYLDLTVTNISHKGSTFIPQNTLKIIVGDNEFDAADLDGSGVSYVSNIEPTLARERECYFELPRSVIKDSFIIRFSGLLAETKDVKTSISTPAPTPEPPIAQSARVPVAETRPTTNVVSAITDNRWTPDALIVSGTLTNTSTVAVLITGIDAKGFNQDQKMVIEGSDFTIVHNDLAPGEVVNFKVALKDDTKQVKFVKVLPSWSP
jgi:hypothetical protein